MKNKDLVIFTVIVSATASAITLASIKKANKQILSDYNRKRNHAISCFKKPSISDMEAEFNELKESEDKIKELEKDYCKRLCLNASKALNRIHASIDSNPLLREEIRKGLDMDFLKVANCIDSYCKEKGGADLEEVYLELDNITGNGI